MSTVTLDSSDYSNTFEAWESNYNTFSGGSTLTLSTFQYAGTTEKVVSDFTLTNTSLTDDLIVYSIKYYDNVGDEIPTPLNSFISKSYIPPTAIPPLGSAPLSLFIFVDDGNVIDHAIISTNQGDFTVPY